MWWSTSGPLPSFCLFSTSLYVPFCLFSTFEMVKTPPIKGSLLTQVHCKGLVASMTNDKWLVASHMLASMTNQSTISPFVIDDNNSCSPYEHAPFVFISPPLASMAKGVHIPVSEISDHCWLLPLSICTILGPVCIPGVTILSPLSSFYNLMNSRCVKVLERPYTWLTI